MSVAITCVPASPTATRDFCKVTVTGAAQNESGAPDADEYPVQAEIKYYLAFELGGDELGRSYVFGVNEDGDHVFNNYVWPTDGAGTIALYDASDDSSVATQAVTVQAAS